MRIINWFLTRCTLLSKVTLLEYELHKLKAAYELSQTARLRLCNDIDKLEFKIFKLEGDLKESKIIAKRLESEVAHFKITLQEYIADNS